MTDESAQSHPSINPSPSSSSTSSAPPPKKFLLKKKRSGASESPVPSSREVPSTLERDRERERDKDKEKEREKEREKGEKTKSQKKRPHPADPTRRVRLSTPLPGLSHRDRSRERSNTSEKDKTDESVSTNSPPAPPLYTYAQIVAGVSSGGQQPESFEGGGDTGKEGELPELVNKLLPPQNSSRRCSSLSSLHGPSFSSPLLSSSSSHALAPPSLPHNLPQVSVEFDKVERLARANCTARAGLLGLQEQVLAYDLKVGRNMRDGAASRRKSSMVRLPPIFIREQPEEEERESVPSVS